MSKMELVVKDNALIDASYSLDLIEQRLILLAIVEARATGQGISADCFLEVHASSYINQFNVEKQTAYEALQNACKNLFRRYFSYTEIDKKTGKSMTVESRWVSKIGYLKEAALVKICFSPDVVPLITRLEANFTSYEIQQISNLSSAYAIRLYELLIKWRSVGQTPIFDLATFRKQLGVLESEYSQMSDFKKWVLHFAQSQINEHTDITVSYEQHKAGRVITGFTFSLKQKKQPKDVTPKSKKAKPNPIEDLNTLLKDKKFLEKHARAGESWDDVRSRLKQEAETGKFSLAPTN